MAETRPTSRRTLIKNVHVITMDDDLGERPSTDILIEGKSILAVGEGLDADGAEIVDGTDRLAIPGLVDTHRHMWQTLLRGWPVDGDLKTIQNEFHHRYGARFTPRDTYISCRVSLAEAMDSGITTIHAWEMNIQSPEHADAVVRAMRESRMRGRFSYGPPSARPPAPIDLDDVLRIRNELFVNRKGTLQSTDDGRLHIGIASRGVELRLVDIWKPEFAFARKLGLPITAHLRGPSIALLAEHGGLGSDILGVHGVQTEDEHIDLLAQHSIPMSVAVLPMAKNGEPSSPIVRFMRRGLRVCLSVDSLAASDNSDMFAIMKMSVLKERLLYGDPTVYLPKDALQQATIDGARAMGLGEITGSITPGKRADLILIRLDDTNMIPRNDAVMAVVFAAQPRNVDSVWIDGVAVKRDGRLTDIDVRALAKDAQRSIDQLKARVVDNEIVKS